MGLNVFLSGQKYFGALVLERIIQDGHRVIGVSAPAEYNGKFDRTYFAAKRAGISVIPAGQLNSRTVPGGVDVLVCAHSHDFISSKLRGALRIGAIGYHPSLLPRHRGRDAVLWTVKMGDRVTGGTVYWLNDNVDGGPVAATGWCFVNPMDDAATLWRDKLQPMGVRLISTVLRDISRGVITMVPQDEGAATWEPSIQRPPIFRPDLLMIGGGAAGFTYVTAKTA